MTSFVVYINQAFIPPESVDGEKNRKREHSVAEVSLVQVIVAK